MACIFFPSGKMTLKGVVHIVLGRFDGVGKIKWPELPESKMALGMVGVVKWVG